MRLRNGFTDAQKKLDLSEKLITDLKKPAKRVLPENHAESPLPRKRILTTHFPWPF
jgi:hypothetical protein